MSRTPQETSRLYWVGAALSAIAWIALFAVEQRVSYSLPVLAAYLAFRAHRASAPTNE